MSLTSSCWGAVATRLPSSSVWLIVVVLVAGVVVRAKLVTRRVVHSGFGTVTGDGVVAAVHVLESSVVAMAWCGWGCCLIDASSNNLGRWMHWDRGWRRRCLHSG